jgi:hypothetical protein
MHYKKIGPALAGMAAMLGITFSLNAQDTLTTWKYSTSIILNTSATGANISTTQKNFPVLIRLTSVNAASLFVQARAAGRNPAHRSKRPKKHKNRSASYSSV